MKTRYDFMSLRKRGPSVQVERAELPDDNLGPICIRLPKNAWELVEMPLAGKSGHWFREGYLRHGWASRFLHWQLPLFAAVMVTTFGLLLFGIDKLAAVVVLTVIILLLLIVGQSVGMHHYDDRVKHTYRLIARRQELARQYGPEESHGSTPRTENDPFWQEPTSRWWIFIPDDHPLPAPITVPDSAAA